MEVHRRALRGIAAAAAVSLSAGACAHVTPDQLDTRLATLQQDMSKQIQDGDQQLGQRIDDVDGKVSRLQADLNEMRQQYDVKIQQLESSLRFDMPVYFDFDKAELLPEGQKVLQKFSQVAQEYYGGALLTVEGFTDSSGSASYNKKLGQRRADAVKDFLVQQGMSADLIRAVSYGEESARLVDPSMKGPGTEGWQNRRVVLVIDHAQDMQGPVASASVSNR